MTKMLSASGGGLCPQTSALAMVPPGPPTTDPFSSAAYDMIVALTALSHYPCECGICCGIAAQLVSTVDEILTVDWQRIARSVSTTVTDTDTVMWQL